MKICKNCGKRFKGRYCPSCGTLYRQYADTEDTGKVSLGLSLERIDSGYVVTGLGSCADVDIFMPAVIEGVEVVEIAPGAFDGCDRIKSVYVPLTVTKIGPGAFSGCSSLEEMTLPFVGGDLFARKKSEETVFGHIFGKKECPGFVPAEQGYRPVWEPHFEDNKVPETVTYYVPESLGKVTVTGGELRYGAFSGCDRLTDVSVSGESAIIGKYAFWNCRSLKSVTLGEGVEVIRQYAFYGCKELSSIAVPGSVVKIAKYAFLGSGLRSVNIPEGVAVISKHSFEDCDSLTTVYLPDGVEAVCRCAFSGCGKLEYIVLPEGLEYIDLSAFQECPSLKRIVIPKSVETITEHYTLDWKKFYTEICYAGNEEDWNGIDCEQYPVSVSANPRKGEHCIRLRYYSEEEPSAKGRYWHYSAAGDVENW